MSATERWGVWKLIFKTVLEPFYFLKFLKLGTSSSSSTMHVAHSAKKIEKLARKKQRNSKNCQSRKWPTTPKLLSADTDSQFSLLGTASARKSP